MTPPKEVTLPSEAKTLLKVGALAGIVYVASRKKPDAPFSQLNGTQRLEHIAIGVSRGYLVGIGIIVVLGVIGLIIAGLGGH